MEALLHEAENTLEVAIDADQGVMVMGELHAVTVILRSSVRVLWDIDRDAHAKDQVKTYGA